MTPDEVSAEQLARSPSFEAQTIFCAGAWACACASAAPDWMSGVSERRNHVPKLTTICGGGQSTPCAIHEVAVGGALNRTGPPLCRRTSGMAAAGARRPDRGAAESRGDQRVIADF